MIDLCLVDLLSLDVGFEVLNRFAEVTYFAKDKTSIYTYQISLTFHFSTSFRASSSKTSNTTFTR